MIRRQPKISTVAIVARAFSSTGGVWSFGDNSHGALGLPAPAFEAALEPTRVPNLPTDVSSIAAGHYHSLAVTSSGHIWAWVRNSEGQLGRADGLFSPRQSWSIPQRVEGLSEVKVHAAFASGVVSAAIGCDGSLWTWGMSKRGQLGLGKGVSQAFKPSRVKALARHNVVKVAFGWGHTLVQTSSGEVFGWGYSAEGRLGTTAAEPVEMQSDSLMSTDVSNSEFDVLIAEEVEKEKNMPIIWEPTVLDELSNTKVADVACGLDHTLILCCDGKLLSSGNNEYGQIGRGEDTSRLLPVEMSSQPVKISAGLGHSLAICQHHSDDDRQATRLLTWGWNWASQLGRQGQADHPMIVESLDESLVSVSGGRAHSLALTSSGQIWTWGSGMNGRLGLGSSANEPEPTMVDSLDGIPVLQAVSGFDHNLLLVAE